MIYLGVGKMNKSKALIAVTSCSNCKINNTASIHFNKHKWVDNYRIWYNERLAEDLLYLRLEASIWGYLLEAE